MEAVIEAIGDKIFGSAIGAPDAAGDGDEPVVTDAMRKAGILALVDLEMGARSDCDIVERVYKAMVKARDHADAV